ncbi:MAG TPA: DUF2961 domain-containing protein [Candidatus Sumerlaeota bacterium]|nr:DUF2961 domain-containing protein [Candidatus Sumerlaeota bacterium]
MSSSPPFHPSQDTPRRILRTLALVSLFSLPLATQAAFMSDLAQPQEGRSMRVSSTHRLGPDGKFDPKGKPDPNSNWDNKNVEPGKTAVLMDEKGPGVITHIWLTFLGPEPQDWAKQGSANHQDMLLRIFYDGEARPAVEAPVGDFFANAFGKRSEVISLPIVVEDADSYNSFWNMPFRKSIRIEIENQSDKPVSLLYFNIDWIQKKIADDIPYFYAQYRQEYPVEKGKDYVVLETQGKGHLVGVALAVRTRSPAWFGEGDEKIWIDGEKDASIWGTGTEDYFLSAWGLKKVLTPYFGVPYFDQWGIVGGHTSAYRWHLNDPIVFNTGIKVAFEHYGWLSPDENPKNVSESWNEREDDFSSVAYWYQTGQPTFTARAPKAGERHLPNLDRLIVPVSAKPDSIRHGDGSAEVNKTLPLPDGHLFYRPAQPTGGWIEIPFEVKTKEPLRLCINGVRSYDYGKYQATLNGVKLGEPVDFYNDKTEEWETHYLDFWPEPGQYTLRLECVGQNPRSQGNGIGIESVRLRERRPRVAEYGHDKDKDWHQKPTLYE